MEHVHSSGMDVQEWQREPCQHVFRNTNQDKVKYKRFLHCSKGSIRHRYNSSALCYSLPGQESLKSYLPKDKRTCKIIFQILGGNAHLEFKCKRDICLKCIM